MIAWKPMGAHAASSRFRAFLPCKYLKEQGWPCEIFRPANIRKYKVVIFQKTFTEETIRVAQELRNLGTRVVFDFGDNLWHYRLGQPASELDKQSTLVQRMLGSVDMVSVPTVELQKVVRSQAPGIPSMVIEDAIEEPRLDLLALSYFRFKLSLTQTPRDVFRIVWYGHAGSTNPSFGMIDLRRILPNLSVLNSRIPISLTVISDSTKAFYEYTNGADFPVGYYSVNMRTLPSLMNLHHACVIPITINQLTLCKSNNRLVLAILAGLPVVADKIPSYEEFQDFVLFSNWTDNLHKYATDSALRYRHVTEGQKYIRAKYNKHRVVSQWSLLLRTVMAIP